MIRELRMTPSAEERRKCTASSSTWCTYRPSIVTWCELSSTTPFFDSATVKPVRFQYGALKSHSPYPESQPAVGAGQEGAVPDGPSLIRIALRGPVSVIRDEAVPARWVRNAPRYVPAASRMVWPGWAAASADWSWAALDTSTTGPVGGPVVGGAVVGGAVVGGAVVGGAVVGGAVVGAGPPPHGRPSMVQFNGVPRPATLKPKASEPPGAMSPFQVALVKR
ncbi:hypothetical protein ACFQ1L_13585 [Phytohabitans flavus]|uniref:hypothetical protein n=1 Tax=Phytohabitans flavus TaxID=1076124 RepID=UPI00363CE7F6